MDSGNIEMKPVGRHTTVTVGDTAYLIFENGGLIKSRLVRAEVVEDAEA